MKLTVLRYSDDGDSTLGLLFIDGDFFCYTLEDEHRDSKVMKETRIDAGVFQLAIQENNTPMTMRYKQKHSWFRNHIEITGLPRHSSVYIHIGNKDEHTAGCLLVGDLANNNQFDDGKITSSTMAFKRLYERIYPYVERSECSIEIIDFDRLYKDKHDAPFKDMFAGWDNVAKAVEQQSNPTLSDLNLRLGIVEHEVREIKRKSV